MENTFTKNLSFQEYDELRKGFLIYLKSINKEKCGAKEKEKSANKLALSYINIFMQNPSIQERRKKSKMTTKKYLYFNSNDISNLITERPLDDYQESRMRIEKIKARLMIFSLEIKGCYKRPPVLKDNYLHDAVMRDVFLKTESPKAYNKEPEKYRKELEEITKSGYFDDGFIDIIEGTYQLYRLSFNNSFAGFVATHTLRIFRNENDPNIICYKTLNSYKQLQSGDKEEGLQRTRKSTGNVFNYQGQMFFFGGISYTHLDVVESGRSKSNYPEIMMMHSHSGDTKNVRGIISAHFPYLGLPVSTRVYMSKLNESRANDLHKIEDKKFNELSQKEKKLVAEHFGNIDPVNTIETIKRSSSRNKAMEQKINFNEGQIKLQKKVRSIMSYIENDIERSYSNMLTP